MKYIAIALGIVMVLVAACGGNPTARVVAEDEIVIAWVGPLSGESASIGIPNLRGVQLAVEQVNGEGGINGKPIKLVIEDDQYDEVQGIAAYQKVVHADGAEVVLTVNYGMALAMADQALADGVLIINSLDSSEEIAAMSDGLAGIGVYDEAIGYVLADAINQKGFDKVAVLTLQDPFLALVEESLQERLDPSIRVETHAYPGSVTDFRSELAKVQDVDAIILLGWDEIGFALKQAKELGYEGERYTIDTLVSESVIEQVGPALEGVHFTFWESEEGRSDALIEAHVTRFGEEPLNLFYTAVGHDAALVTIMAFRAQGEEPLIDTIRSLEPVEGVTGSIVIDEDGVTRSIQESMFTYTVDGLVEC